MKKWGSRVHLVNYQFTHLLVLLILSQSPTSAAGAMVSKAASCDQIAP
jgi:hypothetical protein